MWTVAACEDLKFHKDQSSLDSSGMMCDVAVWAFIGGIPDLGLLLLQGGVPAHHDTVCGGVRPVDGAQLLDDAMACPARRPGQPAPP